MTVSGHYPPPRWPLANDALSPKCGRCRIDTRQLNTAMAGDLAFQCQCSAVQGKLRNASRGANARFTCYCDDCQVFAHHLGHAALLDPNGGTDACHASTSQLEILQGTDHLAALKVANRPLRPVLRWYCRTCSTPLFNTYDNAKLALFGLILANTAPQQRDSLLGPSRGVIWRQFATGDLSARKDANIAAILIRLVGRQISARFSGDWRGCPLFDQVSGASIVVPLQLSTDERTAAQAAITSRAF